MPVETHLLNYSATFSTQEFEKIAQGLIPQEMEDKWFIYFEAGTLSLHRSWTRTCIYQVEFTEDNGLHYVRRARVNRNPEQYPETDDAYDLRLLSFLIDRLLLEKPVPFPIPSALPQDSPAGLYQHAVTGSALPEKRLVRKPWWKFW